MTTTDPIPARLAALKTASAAELKIQWRALFDTDPPMFNRRYLETRLAYRIQELAYGGLKPATVRRLQDLGEDLDGGNITTRRIRADLKPIIGTRLIREWQGAEHCVTVSRVPAAEIEGAVIEQLRAVFRQPEIMAGSSKAAKGHLPAITDDEAREALATLDPLWEELFPAEQARIVQMLIDRVDIGTNGFDVQMRLDGMANFAREMRQAA